MKKAELIFTTALVPLDFIVLFLAGLVAYALRFQALVVKYWPIIFNLPQNKFIIVSLWVIPLWLIIFALNGLYSFQRRKITTDLTKIILSCSAATLLIVVAFFLNTQLFSSRFIILASWALAIIFIAAERILIHLLKKVFYKKGIGVTQVALLGQGLAVSKIKTEFFNNPSFGFRLSGEYDVWSAETQVSLDQLVKDKTVDEIMYLAGGSLEELQQVQNYCVNHYLMFKYVTPLPVARPDRLEFDFLAGLPLVTLKETSLDGWGRIVKRIYDLILALILIVILSPIFLLLAIIVKLDSAGPIFVRLKRIGARQQIFDLFKFRSMVNNAHQIKLSGELDKFNERQDGPLFKMKNDPRITKSGRWLRRWSLDELPQLFNIFWGEMSFVGPRPHEPEEVSKYQINDRRLLTIKPGLTGLAQISGRSDLPWEQEVKLDLYYIENWSIGLDAQILFKTPFAVIRRPKAE